MGNIETSRRSRIESWASRAGGRVAKATAVGVLVVGGAGITAITVSANTGFVTTMETCTGWSASVSLDHNVTSDRIVDVVVSQSLTDAGFPGLAPFHIDTTGNKGPIQIWSPSGHPQAAGKAPFTGWVRLDIKTSDGKPDAQSPYTGYLTPATGCTSTPGISTATPGKAALGTAISDSATVTGTNAGGSPAGSVVFSLFPPSNSTCNSDGAAAVFKSDPVALTSGSAPTSTATGPNYTPTAAGTYHWVAAYTPASGAPYNAATSNCGEEAVAVSQAGPAITTVAAADTGLVGSFIHDTATVTGRVNPLGTGTVTFKLYGPNDTTCSGSVIQTSAMPLPQASNSVDSEPFRTLAPGTYYYVASYSGDANNAAAAPSACGAVHESVVITAPGNQLGITDTTPPTPATGTSPATTAVTVGGFLLLGGLGVALLGMLPKRRSRI